MENEPDFVLTAAGENDSLTVPRGCWVKRRMRDSVRDDHMLIEIQPSLSAQSYGLGAHNIEELLISARYMDVTLFPITRWPCHVYIARVLDETIAETLVFNRDQVQVIAWGRLFRNFGEASLESSTFENTDAKTP